MKEQTNLRSEAVVFILFWIIGSILWGMWAEGLSVPIFGFFSAVLFRLMITLIRWIDLKI